MDIDLRHHQCCEQFRKLCGNLSHLYHHHLADAKSDVLLAEQFLYSHWIARDYACNGRIGRL